MVGARHRWRRPRGGGGGRRGAARREAARELRCVVRSRRVRLAVVRCSRIDSWPRPPPPPGAAPPRPTNFKPGRKAAYRARARRGQMSDSSVGASQTRASAPRADARSVRPRPPSRDTPRPHAYRPRSRAITRRRSSTRPREGGLVGKPRGCPSASSNPRAVSPTPRADGGRSSGRRRGDPPRSQLVRIQPRGLGRRGRRALRLRRAQRGGPSPPSLPRRATRWRPRRPHQSRHRAVLRARPRGGAPPHLRLRG